MASIGEEITIKLIETADLKKGMKILDLGCGNGDVTFLLSSFIGAEGLVVGLDSNEHAIENAKKKANELGLSNLHFLVADITRNFEINYTNFDAIIVRRVLMYLPNVKQTVLTAIRYLKPKGLFLAQENDLALMPIGLASMPVHEKVIDRIRKTLERENVNFNMGFDLNSILTDTGLVVEKIWAEAVVSTPNQPTPWAFLTQVMKDRMMNNKVINDASELELDTLTERLNEERTQSINTFISDLVFCVIARKQ